MYQALVQAYNPRSGVKDRRSDIVTLPPPVGGWNARDAITEISAVKTAGRPAEALTLDNWVPTVGGIQVRKGYVTHVESLTGDYVESLMPYHPASGTAKLFAATPTIIYDATTSGAPSSSVTSMTNGRWSHVNFSTPAVKVLYICNGADTPRYWDGSSWTTTTFTGSGLTVTNLDYVHAHLFRLWFIEKDSLNAWYGPTAAVSGTLEKLPLGALCREGGKLVAIGSWTRDGGSGTDDWIVFLTSKGEVVIYAGSDPSTIEGSALVGVFKIAEPVGRRCLLPLGADLAVVTKGGLISLAQTLPMDEATARKSAVTDRISGAFQQAGRGSGSNFGWQALAFAQEEMAIINIPITERATQHQYVLNTATGAWCRFKGLNAGCWAHFDGDLYFGDNAGAVNRFNTGNTDDGSPITAEMQTAFSNFKTANVKIFSMARPLLAAPPAFLPRVTMQTDYDTAPVSLDTTFAEAAGATWDDAVWDEAEWDAGVVPVVAWQGVNGQGVSGSVSFAIASATEMVFNGIDVNYEVGGPL